MGGEERCVGVVRFDRSIERGRGRSAAGGVNCGGGDGVPDVVSSGCSSSIG